MASTGETQAQIPVIDLRPSNQDAPQQLLDAACHFGFVYVANNEAGISPDLISKLFNLSKEFFALPTDAKEEVSINSNKAGKNHGWLSQGVEKLDPSTQKRPDVKEAFNLGLPSASTGAYDQPLPPLFTQPSNLAALQAFQAASHQLCQKILQTFAIALSLPSQTWFATRHDHTRGPTGSVFRLLYYPRRRTTEPPEEDATETDMRAGAHSDYGSVTLLFQLRGQPGLEILSPRGEWVGMPVDPEPAAAASPAGVLPILVNIGDLLEDWTAGMLRSTKHRVVFPPPRGKEEEEEEGGDRYSIAYFCHPLDEAVLEPVPSRVVEEFAERNGRRRDTGRVITAKDHLMERLAATYKIKE